MGDLAIHDLSQYKCDAFVETGTGRGAGIAHALQFNFRELHTIEANNQLYMEMMGKIKDKRLLFWEGTSYDILKMILPIPGKVLFWLDAHFINGADFQLDQYDFGPENFPLKKELEIIKLLQPNFCAIIDDLNLLEPGDYELAGAPLPDNYQYPGTDWIRLMFPTHQMIKINRHQGFLILCA
jgi:hypothetical protein